MHAETQVPQHLENLSAVRVLIDRISEYITSSEQTDDPEIQQIWMSYRTICTEINSRLAECVELISTGFWYDAVRLAEIEPDLLNAIQLLDFEARPAWEQLAVDFGWKRLAGVAFDRAESLHRAYEVKETLQPLMKRHIELALVRAPLDERIAVMKKLAASDPYCSTWRQDIELFEKERYGEIDLLIDHAWKSDDYELLVRLIGEFWSDSWLTRPTKKLVQKVGQIESAYLTEVLLPYLATQLAAAQATKDIEQGMTIRGQWNDSIRRVAALTPEWRLPSAVQSSANPCLLWLRGIDDQARLDQDYQSAVAYLQSCCNQHKVTYQQLRDAEQAVLVFGIPLPSHIADQVRQAKFRIAAHVCLLVFGAFAIAFALLLLMAILSRKS